MGSCPRFRKCEALPGTFPGKTTFTGEKKKGPVKKTNVNYHPKRELHISPPCPDQGGKGDSVNWELEKTMLKATLGGKRVEPSYTGPRKGKSRQKFTLGNRGAATLPHEQQQEIPPAFDCVGMGLQKCINITLGEILHRILTNLACIGVCLGPPPVPLCTGCPVLLVTTRQAS